MSMDNLIKPRRQTNWDWRAAGNFICGGCGTGLLAFAAFASQPQVFVAALALVALGLLCVWLEIGRPLRAMNVFLHAHTSWMTRESLVAPPLFLCGVLAAWTGSALWMWPAALLALLFLYCQARILHAAKGIPAWRAKGTVPLIIATGLTEGAGLLAMLLVICDKAQPGWLAGALLVLLAARAWAWRSYRKELSNGKTPRQALTTLNKIEVPFMWTGHGAAAVLILVAFALPSLNGPALVAGAGLLAMASGWLLKYTIIVRASYNQGYALPRVPVRGAGISS
ncbi:phenylacetyl-CoA:acceptor oxidoreductase [Herbaspirillum sp. HC18]|nr:phenylacetyl-CoA:acceptor oxidoreductase [Herbaspirillum sp. HC18]